MEWRRHLGSGLVAGPAALLMVALSWWPAGAASSELTPSPQTVQIGTTIGLSVTGFKPCTADQNLTVRWDQAPLALSDVVAGPAGSDRFTADAVVPSSPAGLNQIDAGCSVRTRYLLQESGSVYVVTLTPSVPVVQAGGPVTMTGSGFVQCADTTGSTTIELSANGAPLATASGTDGDFQQVITVPPGTVAGPYAVTAQCSAQPGNDLASASVDVVTLVLSPGSGIPGTAISVTGGGYTQCHQVQLRLLRDAAQAVAAGGPIIPANGSFTAEVTVPSSAVPGNDYQVDAGCYPAAAGDAPIAVERFTVTPPASTGSPTPSSTAASSPVSSGTGSPSPAPSGTGSPSAPGSPSPSPVTAASARPPRHTGGLGTPVALIGGTGAGLALVALVRVLSVGHGRRGRGWVNKHLRVVAGWAGPLSADVERRPGAMSVSVGLEPHLDRTGNQQYEEVAR
jgi:hypothetical protein